MYKAFHFKEVNDLQSFFSSRDSKNYKGIGERLFEEQKKIVKASLDEFYIKENVLDGQKLMDEWFPKIKAHIFLSHSHADKDFIYSMAGFLFEEFGLISFIDSVVWGYADELLRKVDEHCYNPTSKTYNYYLRNKTTSNVYLMLNNALYNMIDSTECIIFINTPNSVKKISEILTDKTYSPWIYSELNLINKVRIVRPKRSSLVKGFEKRSYSIDESVTESLQIAHDISIQLEALNDLHFNEINYLLRRKSNKESYQSAEFFLDCLYESKGWLC